MSILNRTGYYAFNPVEFTSLVALISDVIEGWQRKKAPSKAALRERFFPHRVFISQDRSKAIVLNKQGVPLGINKSIEVDGIDFDSFKWCDVEDFNVLTGDFRFIQGSYDPDNLSEPFFSYVELYNDDCIPEKTKSTMRRYLGLVAKLESVLTGTHEVNIFCAPAPALSTFAIGNEVLDDDEEF